MENETFESFINKKWKYMLQNCYTCKCKETEGFSIRLSKLNMFSKKFKGELKQLHDTEIKYWKDLADFIIKRTNNGR